MYDTSTNPTTTYVEVGDCVESSVSGRFSSSNSYLKFKRRFYNTRYLRFGWTRRPPRETQQHKHKYFRTNQGHSLIEPDHQPQSAPNTQRAKIARYRPKAFKRASPGAYNPLSVTPPAKKTTDNVDKTTAAKAKTLPAVNSTQRQVTGKTSATMKIFRTSETTQLLPSSQDPIASNDSEQINCSGDQSDSRNNHLCDTSF